MAARYLGVALTLVIAIVAATVVSTLTIDLGPAARTVAEREGSKRLNRAVRIGRLSIHLLRGRVLLEDLSIDGREAGDRPFFTAKRLSVSLDWTKALARRPEFVITSVELIDWEMLVEEGPNGHSFPRLSRGEDDDGDDGPRQFTTTLKYLRAWRGQFAYENHGAPWSIVAPNIDLNINHHPFEPHYRGQATFADGTVRIQQHLPMWTNMNARFVIDGSNLRMERIDIGTDGAQTVAVGSVAVDRWPEMRYDVTSRVHFPRLRELFFKDQPWQLAGDGDFTGVFRLFRGGHDLAGSFTSDVLGVYDYRFPALHGSLHWTRKLFEVTNAGANLFGGAAAFDFSIAPLGSPQRWTARFGADYTGVDLQALTDFYALKGVRFAGLASGRHELVWPQGRFSENRQTGRIAVTMPAGSEPMTASLAAARAADADHTLHEWGPFAPLPLAAHLPIAGELKYELSPDQVVLEGGRIATERTHVAFEGTTDWGERARLRFHVTSSDWQESDQLLAGIITDFGSPTNPVPFGGRGEFDGVMTGPFRNPRVEGRFSGEDLRAWDTIWGEGDARIVYENDYLTVRNGLVRQGDSEIRAEGLFAVGSTPAGADEINARFRVTRRDLDGLRHAFEIDDYPVSGLLTGDFILAGEYARPVGFGAMTVEDGVAYGEPFQKGTAALRFDGMGVRLDAVSLGKGSGTVTGAAYIGWDSTYSFNADARRIPVEQIAAFAYPQIQPTGLLEFSAGGSGTFDLPRYDVRFRINDLFVAEEGVGQVTGTLALRGKELSAEIDAASPRLAITGTGRMTLTPQADAELSFRFHDSSLDPYVRLFVPQLSPFTTAVASGSIRVVGELADVDHLLVDARVDSLDVRLFDYAVHNAKPIRLALDQNVVRVENLQLIGVDTRLAIGGRVTLHDQTIALQAVGDANLGILQGFFRDVRGSGRAELSAAVNGPLYEPVFSGNATITDGRVRHFSLPNSVDSINGVIHFDSRGLRLDDVTAVMGGGPIQFGGRVGFDGYLPGELSVSARGTSMQVRYPEGVRSVVDADLTVRGNFKAPTLVGTVTVRNALWNRRIDPTGGLFDFSRGGGSAATDAGEATTPAVPLRFDLQVQVPSTLRIQNNLARLVASADLQLRGTYDRPQLFGRAEVDRGEVIFEGRRYLVTKGAIDFTNPTRVEPFFDVEAETRVRVPGQTYRVIVRAAGTMERLQPTLESDPPLPAADVLALLFSDVRRDQGPGNAELRALQNPIEAERDILTTRATQLLASPLSSEVGRVVEQTFGVDSFQLTPSLFDPYSQSQTTRVNPSARVTVGKRISDRVYLTFSRSLNSSFADQILLLEYDESDRLSWILSRNEDETYAIEVRVRHTF
jgi:hypothetical protein